MKKLVKILSVVCATALISLSFTGCAPKEIKKNAEPVSTQKAAEVVSEPTKPITMRFAWWGGDSRHKATLDAIAAYKVRHPMVTIEGEYGGYDGYQQKLMIQLAGATMPDLIQIDSIWNAQLGAQKDNFVNLSTEKLIDITQFDDKVLKGFCTSNGIILGLPMGINGFGIMMNKTFMQKNNIPLDTQWTWDKVIEEGKKIHEKDKNLYLMQADLGGLQAIFMSDYTRGKYGKYWANDDYVVAASKEELTEQFKTLKALFDSGAFQPLGEMTLYNGKMEQNPKLINGEVGMMSDWSGTVSKNKAAIKSENFATGQAITVKDGKDKSTTYKPSMLLAVNKKSPNAQEAAKFTNWMLNDKEAALILKDQRSIPGSASSRKALLDANELDKDILQMVENTLKNPAEPVPLILNNSEIAEITKDVCSKVVFGKVTPEQGADELIKTVTAKLNDLKPKK